MPLPSYTQADTGMLAHFAFQGNVDTGMVATFVTGADTGMQVSFLNPAGAQTAPTYFVRIAHGPPGDEGTWVDITDRVITNTNIVCKHGQADELSGVTAGTITMSLDDYDGAFDHYNVTTGPYASVPWNIGVQIQVGAVYEGVTYYLAYGYVDSIKPTFLGPFDANVQIQATDFFKRFGFVRGDIDMTANDVPPYTPILYRSTSEALGYAMVIGNFNGAWVNFEDSGFGIRSQVLTDVSPLDVIDSIVKANPGVFWMDGQGKANYISSGGSASGTSIGTFGQQGVYPITQIEVDTNDQLIYNQIEAGPRYTVIDGIAQDSGYWQIDATSQEDYGVRVYKVDAQTINWLPEGENGGIAEYLLGRYKQPCAVIRSITLDGAAMPQIWPIILGAEIGQRLTLMHNRPGTTGLVNHDFWVISVEHTINLVGIPYHLVKLGLTFIPLGY